MRNSLRYFVSLTAFPVMKGHEDGGLMFFGKYEALPATRTRRSRWLALSDHTLERR